MYLCLKFCHRWPPNPNQKHQSFNSFRIQTQLKIKTSQNYQTIKSQTSETSWIGNKEKQNPNFPPKHQTFNTFRVLKKRKIKICEQKDNQQKLKEQGQAWIWRSKTNRSNYMSKRTDMGRDGAEMRSPRGRLIRSISKESSMRSH